MLKPATILLWRLLAVAALAAVLSVLMLAPGQAQNGGNASTFKDDLAQWEATLKSVEDAVSGGPLEPEEIVRLRTRAEAARDGAREAKAAAEKDAAEVKQLLESLGPKPKEGEPPETAEVAAQRAALEARLADAEGRTKQSDLIITRVDGLIAQISGVRRAGLAEQLSRKGPPLFAAKTWKKALPEFGGWLSHIANAPGKWWASEKVQTGTGTGVFAGAIAAILLAILLGITLRRWLLRRWGRDPAIQNPTFPRRFIAAAAEGAARGLLPLLLTWTVYAGLSAQGLLIGSFGDVIEGLAVAISTFALITGLTRAALAPRSPRWRIKQYGDRAARMLYQRIRIAAALISVQLFLLSPRLTLDPSDELTAAIGFIFRLLMAIVFLSLLDPRLWYSAADEDEHQATGKGDAESGGKSGTAHHGFHLHRYWWLRLLLAGVAIAIPVSSLAGYHELSRFLTSRLVTVTAVVSLYLLVREFVRDMTDVFLDPERGYGARTQEALNVGEQGAGMLRFWLVFLIDLVLVIGTGLLLLILLGFDWRELSDWATQIMSGFAIGGRNISPRDVLTALLVFVIFYALVRLLQGFLDRQVLPNTRLDIGVRTAVRAGVGYLGITIAALVAITAAGFDLSNLAIIAGALSVGIGFGLQNIVNNFVSGIILLVERPIKVGDWVVAGGSEGFVKRISVRSTEIETFQLASVIVPNSELISSSVTNWTHKDPRVRSDIAVGVSYASDPDHVHEILLRVASENETVLTYPEPFVVFKAFGDSSLDFELRCYVPRATDMVAVASDIRYAIMRAFRDEGIEIPFPQQDLHIRDIDRLERAMTGSKAEPAASEPRSKPRRQPRGAGESGEADGDD